jgi:signal transduction histidine kinase/CheY-like chemotaxis protein/PAS domain-containing protein
LKRPLARYVRRHRRMLIDAVSRPLEGPLDAERARAEATTFVDGLAAAFVHTDTMGVLDRIRVRFADWRRVGVDSDRLLGVLTAIIRSHGEGGPVRGLEWAHDARTLLDLVPTPVLLVDADDRVTAANRAFSALGGEAAEVLPGLTTRELFEGLPPAGAVGAAPQRVTLRQGPGRALFATRTPVSASDAHAGWLLTFTPEPEAATAESSLPELLQREKVQKEKFAALLTVSHAVVNSLDLNTILSTIAKQVRQVIQTDECTVFLFDEKEQVLYPVVCDASAWIEELMAVRLKLGQGITGMVAKSGRGEIVNDSENDPRALRVPGTPPEQSSLLCAPMHARDKLMGVLTLNRLGERGFQQEDLDLATLFAGQCSAAIANARLYADVKRAFDELREAQAQLVQSAKLNALGEMAGGVAHDFNNILAAILGRTQLMLQTVPDPELRKQLAVIEQAALDGAQTVRRVQEFTRVRQDERFVTIDLNQVLLDVLELTRPAWETGPKRRGVSIDVHLELSASHPVAGNASELREVFTNLVLNAVDAMPDGGELWVSTENGPDTVRVTVRDNGVGMDEETRAKIFDPFFTTKELKGTGLGLSVAYGIVSRHRGTIEVVSEPRMGTVFALRFPVGTIELEHGGDDSGQPMPRLRVLVVDDEEAVLEVLGDMLGIMGMEVTRAHGGPAGVAALERGAFDLVFTDLGMPEVNGWDLALTAKSRRADTAVVLVTGWGFQLEEDAATSRGVDRVMAKPFSWEDVQVAVREVGRAATSRAA